MDLAISQDGPFLKLIQNVARNGFDEIFSIWKPERVFDT